MTTEKLLPPLPERTRELRAKGWEHRCIDLRWYPAESMPEAERALCRECGSVHYRWKRDQ